MPDAIVLAPLLLAGVLLLSGVAKLRHPGSGHAAFEALRVPKRLSANWIVGALPYAELALALGLLLTQGWVLLGVALLAAVLCGGYWVLIVRAVRAGASVNCNCFGQLTAGAVGPWTVIRNSVLLLVAVVVVVDAALRRPVWLARVIASDAAQAWWLVGAAVTAALVALVLFEPRTDGSSAVTSSPLPAASAVIEEGSDDGEYVRRPIPRVSLVDAAGAQVPLQDLARDQAVLLVWVSFACGACVQVMSQFADWAARIPQLGFRLVVPDLAALERRSPELMQFGLADPDGYVQAVFHETGVPLAVLLGADGQLAGGPVLGLSGIRDIVDEIAARFDALLAEQAVPVDESQPTRVAAPVG